MRAWLERRADWWAGHEPLVDSEVRDAAMERGRRAVDEFVEFIELSAAREGVGDVVVWTGDTASEQLHLCWLAAVLPVSCNIHVARAGMGIDRAVGIGHLDGQELAATQWELIGQEARAELAGIWRAYVASSPEGFVDYVGGVAVGSLTTTAPTAMISGLKGLLGRFHSVDTGLTVWEEALLRRIVAYPSEAVDEIVWGVIRQRPVDECDFIGDLSLLGCLRELADGGLLAHDGDSEDGGRGRYVLTALGRDVLAGRVNRVRVAGFDRWFGGTRLRAVDGAMWWRDGDRVRVRDVAE